jgi:hypothetical protein
MAKKESHLFAASLMVLEDFIGLSGAETMNLVTIKMLSLKGEQKDYTTLTASTTL